MIEWTKHFQEQVINKGNFNSDEIFILTEMFDNLTFEVSSVDEDGQRHNDEEMIDAYFNVIWQYLAPENYSIFQRIVRDMTEEAEEQEKAYHQRRSYPNE